MKILKLWQSIVIEWSHERVTSVKRRKKETTLRNSSHFLSIHFHPSPFDSHAIHDPNKTQAHTSTESTIKSDTPMIWGQQAGVTNSAS